MAPLGKSQDGEEEEWTTAEAVTEAVVNDKTEGKMWSLNSCVLFTCYFLLRIFMLFYNENIMHLSYFLHNSNAYTQE